jgi:hypothetical protein
LRTSGESIEGFVHHVTAHRERHQRAHVDKAEVRAGETRQGTAAPESTYQLNIRITILPTFSKGSFS